MRDACSCSATTAGAPLRPRVRAPPRLERPFHGLRTLGITPPGRGPGCALARIAPETAARAAQRSLSMRYLVTGGAGFIGSHLVEHLVTSRHEVVVLDDFSSGSRENLAAVAHRVRLVTGSVADASACAEAMRGVHFVLHHAALTSVVGSVADPVAADRVNVAGTVAVLHAAREAGVRRVVLAGSTAVYGDTPHLPNRETTLPRPLPSAWRARSTTSAAEEASRSTKSGSGSSRHSTSHSSRGTRRRAPARCATHRPGSRRRRANWAIVPAWTLVPACG